MNRQDCETEIIVKKIINEARYKELRKLASKITKRVTRNNAKNLVLNQEHYPDIKKDCKRFKVLTKKAGFNPPESINDLYNEVIYPIHLHFAK
ncbi:hypothetical protein ACFLZ9_00935 [Patescibacteria group bacterium]